MDTNLRKIILRRFKEVGVVEPGNFRLRSGEYSKFYLDIKKAYGFPQITALLGLAIGEEMKGLVTCVASSGHGGIPLGSIISEKYDKYQDVVCELADEIEIYEYWHVSDALAYHLEQASEIVLDRKYWARTCTGQSTKLDYVMMQIFIKLLRERK